MFLDQKAIGLPCWMSTAPRPNPAASHTRSKMGLPSDVSGRAKHGAEVRAVFNPAKAFWQAVVQSKGVFFFSNTVSGIVKLV